MFPVRTFAGSLQSTHWQRWLPASCHSSDLECIHNISLLFARQKMVVVIESCWLAPLQSRSECVRFSFRSCESDALFPVWASLPTKHTSKSFMIISLSDDYIVAKSLVQVFCIYIYFSFCHLGVCPL